MLFDPVIVSQHNDDIELITESDTYSLDLLNKAADHIFPLGRSWHLYTNARSFRFVPLNARHSLLSYTLVLGEGHGTWNGRLHAWGLIGKSKQLVGEDGLTMFSPQGLFEFYQNTFVMDEFYEAMVNGLSQPIASPRTSPLTWWEKTKLYASRLRMICQYDNPAQWATVERLVYETFREKMKTPRPFGRHRQQPITFSTLALSKQERTEILGIPAGRKKQPRICLIGI
jgi:hypothetical protein